MRHVMVLRKSLKTSFFMAIITIVLISFNFFGVFAGTATTVTVDCASNGGTVNPNLWAVGSPDKYTWWVGNANLQQRISDAKIKLVRMNPIQLLLYNGKDPYPSHNTWNWTDMDAAMNYIFNAGAQPIFTICKFPGGVPHTFGGDGKTITSADWNEYGNFMAGVVRRYNVDKVLGATKTIKYWEMWNEPSIEGDGVFASASNYSAFVTTVGNAMKAVDSTIKLIGPVAPWAELTAGGWVSYTAKNNESQIDILCWHNYGPDATNPANTDAIRMAYTVQNYQTDMASAKAGGSGGALQGPSGKLYGAAITEYNISWQDAGASYNAKYHNEFAATYDASAIINAMKANADIFSQYNLAETGSNLLGLVSNTDYSPYKPYYTYYLFGNFTGNQILTSSGGATNLEYYATKDSTTGKYYVTVVNKDTSGVTFDVRVNLNSVSNTTGTVNVRKVDATTNPTSIYATLNYSNSTFTYSVAPYSVVSFEVTPGTGAPAPTPTPTPTSTSVPTPTATPGGALFQSGLETGDTQPTWIDTQDGSQNVGAFTGDTTPRCNVSTAVAYAGTNSIMYSGHDNDATASYCKYKVYDVNIPITADTKMSFWIYPTSDNARYCSIDYYCTDGSSLRDSGAADYNGYGMHPNQGHGGNITLNAWTQIKCNVGLWLNGKTIDRIQLNYDRPANTGDYKGYIDDIVITNGALPGGVNPTPTSTSTPTPVPTPTPTQTPIVTPTPTSAALFQSGLETGDTQPAWIDTLDGSQNVGAFTGDTIPRCNVSTAVFHAGSKSIMYSGKDNSASASYCKYKVFDVNIAIVSTTKMSFWIYPTSDNARYCSIDYYCTDGTTLRDSGATDYNGYGMHPNQGHGGNIPLNGWTQIKCNIGQWLNGKTIDRIQVNYDRPANTGDYKGYIDDIIITNGTLP